MKIAFFQFYPPTLWTPGGGEIQLIKTKEALEKLGFRIDLFNIWHPQKYDILHIFGSTYQLSDFVVIAKRLGMKVVVSAIAYSNKPWVFWKIWSLVDNFLPIPTLYTYRKRIYKSADIIISGSRAEANQLINYFNVPKEKIRIVYNAADKKFAEASPEPFIKKYGLKDFVLMVGRINNHKGQLRLIEALEGQGIDLVFIGRMDPEDPTYFEKFQQAWERKPWIHYLGGFDDQEMLASAYAAAKVHVLPSLSESTGLVSLEAGLAGANVVAVKDPPVYEYLGDEAFYCNPQSIFSIREAVLKAYQAPRNLKLRERLLREFTWERVAEKILNIYKELLNE